MKTGKMVVASAVVAVLVAMGAMALAGGPSGTPLPATTSSTVPTPGPSPTTVDISGPCDEAEHVNDPRCAGGQIPQKGDRVDGAAIDISGPCDEAEHVNDPRCTTPGAEDDRSGPSGDEDMDDRSGPSGDDDDDDNSGPSENSGPGNASDDD